MTFLIFFIFMSNIKSFFANFLKYFQSFKKGRPSKDKGFTLNKSLKNENQGDTLYKKYWYVYEEKKVGDFKV